MMRRKTIFPMNFGGVFGKWKVFRALVYLIAVGRATARTFRHEWRIHTRVSLLLDECALDDKVAWRLHVAFAVTAF